ncbi:hypothetical protein AB6H26_08360 [Providencia hangzhouensis]|uniref:Uncharacterized protein n=1 Tax=Providencia rettgeri TaxID=587 RepID=A0A9N8D378_PRORE|nr:MULTISPECIES: hypothetical protein [Providencia]MCB4855642.1 hypothetical protein [Providencia rettgeri]MCW4539367.1 hypothetical protein [Providencia rettgeri]MDX4117353.1 hypothetical protein [Providencia rettgeri]UPQ40171.1 hypothetical protein LV777_04040 [Providencia rettgeri]CAB5649813.1 Uncharacterised protein [Providencia rettgeri]
MATSSFSKDFVVKNHKDIDNFLENYNKPQKVSVPNRDYEASSKKGIQSLKRKLSSLQQC